MNSYHIVERNMDMTYIELRILMEVECPLKSEKITQILNFLNNNGFLNHLTIFATENLRAENMPEREDVMSLTIDMRDDKLRFKFWNGASTMWLFHTQDLFDALDTGREEFAELYDKYEPITELLLDFRKRWNTSIYRISYKYNPNSDVEMLYNIIFTDDVKQTHYASKILYKIDKEIKMLGEDITQGLKFNIEHSYQEIRCSLCEQKRREREQNKEENTRENKE